MRPAWHQLLDRLAAGGTTIAAVEIRPWEQLQFDGLIRLGLLREMELAATVLCDQCGEPHWADVRWNEPGKQACFGCPAEGVIEIDVARLRQWRIDGGRVAARVAEALELTGPVQPVDHGRLWHIGRRRIAGRFRDVFLATTEPGRADEVIEKVLKYGGLVSGVILLPGPATVGGAPSQVALVDLAAITRTTDDAIAIDFDYLEDLLPVPASAPPQRARSIPAPAGASWKDVAMLVSDGLLQITIRGRQAEKTPEEAGFSDPDQRLELLKLFAAGRGTLPVDKLRGGGILTGDSPLKTRVLRLRQLLQSLIEIDGDPIEHNRKAGTYSCQFEIRLSADEGFRTPAGATWLDFTFEERADGRIAVSVAEKRRFRAVGAKDRSGRILEEVAEREQATTLIHSLEEMGLRNDRGKLNAEGTVFLKLLRTYPQFRSLSNRGNSITWTGELQPTARSATYQVEISYSIPVRPQIRVLRPELTLREGHRRLPHVFEGNLLCVHEAYDWNAKMMVAYTIVPWISAWLYFYEVWLDTGYWEGEGTHPNSPEHRSAA